MPDIWVAQPIKVYKEWCRMIICHGKDVSPWEQDFTKSLETQLETRNLSQRQAEILERIYANKT